MMLPRQCLGAVIITSFPLLAFADYFTNPPSFVDLSDGTQIKAQDLSMTCIFGKKLQITWFVPSLPFVTLTVIHWGSSNNTIISSLLTNKENHGYHSWIIGTGDGVDLKMISDNPNFGLQLEDPTGKLTSTGNPPGFIDSTLRSRGFVIKSNIDPSSSTSTSASAPSTLSPSKKTSIPSPLRTTSSASTTTTASASTTPPLHSNLSRSAVAGLATGFCVVSILALIAVFLLEFQRRLTKNVQAKNADLVARTERLAGANSMGPELPATLNVSPSIVELSARQSFPLGQELGESRFSRQELSAEKGSI